MGDGSPSHGIGEDELGLMSFTVTGPTVIENNPLGSLLESSTS